MYQCLSRTAVVAAALLLAIPARGEEASLLDTVTVTGTREETPRAETPLSVDVIGGEEIEDTRPVHPSEIMGRIPGVHVNVTGGEGHMTAIRQPLTTSPVYLFLEDGVPTRSAGFFNHNALYEVDLPQAGAIEVVKGPGTALHGSDAIGGVINVLTRPAPADAELDLSLDAGAWGFSRFLGSAGDSWGENGLRADLNLTHTDGWRDATAYDRRGGVLRWDHTGAGGVRVKTILSVSDIDQQTAGSSAISKEDYLHDPTTNYAPISFRDVFAGRVSVAWEKRSGQTLLSATPYLRNDRMEILPNWSLSYDPSIYETRNTSVGLLLKIRRDYEPWRTRLVAGADLDHSPGSRVEHAIDPVRTGKIYTDYTPGELIYDYDVTFQGLSPYLHLETSPTQRLRLQAGLRLDLMSFDYDNKLDPVQDGPHRRPADTVVDYAHLSPKLGATWALTPAVNAFASCRHAFRVPSESQLFRQGKSEDTVDLEPVKADNYEAGLRGRTGNGMEYEVSVYWLSKKDDIVRYTDTTDGTRETLNAGETLHRGIEAGMETPLARGLDLDVAFSYAIHSYRDWSPKTGVDYSGNEMSVAPRVIASSRLVYRRPGAGRAELEWEHLGSYWMDDANTHKYPGHDLFNLRLSHPLAPSLELYAKVLNLTDERYATRATYTAYRGEEYAPGMPRSWYLGLSYRPR